MSNPPLNRSQSQSSSASKMQFLLSSILTSLTPRVDDDVVDRLNCYYTVLLTLVCMAVSTAKQYMGKPIHCWMPPQFTPSMEQYIEAYCWIQNTYWLPLHEHIPDDLSARVSLQIGYYQWTPFILALEALMFYMPTTIWRVLSWQSGINMQVLITQAKDAQGLESSERYKSLTGVAECMEDTLLLQQALRHRGSWRFCFPRCLRTRYIAMSYLLVKLLYTANVIGQFFLLNTLLSGERTSLYAVRVLSDLLHGRQWRESGHFPRITLCDFEVKYLGNLNRYTVQCALIANLFNEKIFAILWCWYFLLAGITFSSLLYWLVTFCSSDQRLAFVAKYIEFCSNRDDYSDSMSPKTYGDFVHGFLGLDGAFMIRMLASHAGDVTAMEVVSIMWGRFQRTNYNGHKGKTPPRSPPNDHRDPNAFLMKTLSE